MPIFEQFKKEQALWEKYVNLHGDTEATRELRGVGEYAIGPDAFFKMVEEADGRRMELIPPPPHAQGNSSVQYVV